MKGYRKEVEKDIKGFMPDLIYIVSRYWKEWDVDLNKVDGIRLGIFWQNMEQKHFSDFNWN